MAPLRPLLAVTAGLALVACATPPPVQVDGLKLKRVVIYRNGIGYFERAGRVESDKVTFKVRGNEVGDFLGTFAVIEKGGSSVRAASFPLKIDRDGDGLDDDAPPAVPIVVPPGSPPPPPPPKPDPNKLETVIIELDGREHDIEVGYIASTPVWRPSYRLVVGKDDAVLQAWGIVQNLSGEDWNSVSLSLIAEAPLSFTAMLALPVTPQRPSVTDSGDVIGVVLHSDTTLAQEAPPPAPPPPAAVAPSPSLESPVDAPSPSMPRSAPAPRPPRAEKSLSMGSGSGASRPGVLGRGRAGGGGGGALYESPRAEFQTQNPSRMRNLSALAAVGVETGTTRYDIPVTVTIPNKTSTMVMLLDARVPGQSIFLFAPEGGVPQSASHPFRVARFTNKTGGLLERGPIAIFSEGAFIGQGMLDGVPEGATTTVPFALERSLAIEGNRTSSEQGFRIAKIEAGALTLERDVSTRTTYNVRNGGNKAAKVMMKHARTAGARLHKPPPGTEDNTGTGSALVPVDVAARGKAEVVVDERQAQNITVDWMSPVADDAVNAYMNERRADPAVVAQLKVAWGARRALLRAREERNKLVTEQGELARSTEETRNNIKALEKNKAADDLRKKLTDRLAESSLRMDQITKLLIEVDLQINEQQVRFTESVRAIKMLDPPKSA